MTIADLAQARAEAAARVEYLDGITKVGDSEEVAAHYRARALARAAYRQAESDYQRAVSLLTPEELAVLMAAAKGREAA